MNRRGMRAWLTSVGLARRLLGWFAEDIVRRTLQYVLAPAVLAVVGLHLAVSANEPGTTTARLLPSLADQWQHERSQMAREGWTVASETTTDLRGAGVNSTVVNLEREGVCAASRVVASSQVRVYDEIEGRLVDRVTYMPPGCQGSLTTFHGMDIFGNGRHELVGSLHHSSVTVPLVVNWSDAQQRYEVSPLIGSPPEIAVPHRGGSTTTAEDERALRRYLDPVRVGASMFGYGVSAFSLTASNNGGSPYLAGVYRLNIPSQAWHAQSSRLYERAAWAVQQTVSQIGSGWCHVLPNRLLIRATGDAEETRIVGAFAKHLQAFLYGCASAFVA
jgi:hypothetical protein